jgi:hypothetical protein|tara:strand:+ start:98 stop:418 length:321 start_codon:yes stop_codon:yes gene_type:complete
MAKKIGTDTKVGIDHDGDGKPDFHIDLKTIGMLLVGISTVIGMWFTLQSDIEDAKKLPLPPIERVEYDLKDELIRQTIMDTQEDVESILKELEKIDDRLYELQKNR